MQGRVGIRERSYNSGPEIDHWLRHVGLSPRNPYCAACMTHALDSAKVAWPRIRTGLAMNYRLRGSFKATDVLSGKVVLLPGDLVIWQKGNTIYGHIGVVETVVDRRTVITIEANTSSGVRGSQRDGDGVYRRRRLIEPYNYFGIKYATRPRYA